MLDKSAHIVENLIKYADPIGATARYLNAVSNPHYNSAFGKMLACPQDAHLRFSAAETEAVRTVSQVMEERALAEGTGSSEGFAIPITIDPSVILTGSGALNPVREVARVLTVGTREWRGVSSDGVTAGYVAEAVEATDASPVLAQPILKAEEGRAFVPFSIELDQDWSSLQQELVRLITDARSVLDATKFLLGSGTSEPSGILNIGALNGLTTTQRIQTFTTAVTAWVTRGCSRRRSRLASSPTQRLPLRRRRLIKSSASSVVTRLSRCSSTLVVLATSLAVRRSNGQRWRARSARPRARS